MRLNSIAAVLKASTSPKDWVEDGAEENGRYLNDCIVCGHVFRGHKRRVVCKECDAIDQRDKGERDV